MSLNVTNEKLLTFNQAADLLPEKSRPSLPTWWRWWRHGVRGCRLDTVLIGGRRYTTAAALQDFVDAVTAAANGELPAARTSTHRDRDRKRAQATLLAAGLIKNQSPADLGKDKA